MIGRHTRASFVLGALLTGMLGGCNLPGKPKPGPEVPLPSAQLNFQPLYAQNCSACHGENGRSGAALALNYPEYLALADDQSLKNVTANGIKGGLMPGFASSAGGMLTDAQIEAIVRGMRTEWGKGDVLAGANPPSYAASKPGDVARGADVYRTACARCHGGPESAGKRGSILAGSYLALMDAQSLRTVVIVGRPEWGMPDWRNDIAGHPLTDENVTDVVAWMQSQTPPDPGRPYPKSQEPRVNTLPPAKGEQSPRNTPKSKGGR